MTSAAWPTLSSLFPAQVDHPFVRAAGRRPILPRISSFGSSPDPAAAFTPPDRFEDSGPGGRGLTLSAAVRNTPLRLTVRFRFAPRGDAVRIAGEIAHVGSAHAAQARVAGLGLPAPGFDAAVLGSPTLHHAAGGPIRGCFPPSAPTVGRTTLLIGLSDEVGFRLQSAGRRDLPYFRLTDAADSAGLFAGLEWAGDWTVDFRIRRDDAGPALSVLAMIDGVDAVLEPGESLPLPAVFYGLYRGDSAAGADALRRYLRGLRPNSRPAPTAWSSFTGFGSDVCEALLAPQIAFAVDLGCEYFVVDAGWNAGAGKGRDTAGAAAGFREARDRFPQGLRCLADTVDKFGMGFGLGVEIERAHTAGEFARARPDGLLLPPGVDPEHYVGPATPDFGRRDVCEWAIAGIDELVERYRPAWLRLDAPLDPGPLLAAADEPGRAGLTALRYYAGLAAVLDEVRRRRRDLLIEHGWCGGRRLHAGLWAVGDLFRLCDRAVDPDIARRLRFAAAEFFPPEATAVEPGFDPDRPDEVGPEAFAGALVLGGDLRTWSPARRAAVRAAVELFRRLRPLLAADSYPLCPEPTSPADADGRQFHDPATRRGLLLAYTDGSAASAASLRLRHLEPAVSYRLGVPGTNETFYRTGRMLMEGGLELPGAGALPGRRDRRLLAYEAVNG
jgi:alpha-galactosidase